MASRAYIGKKRLSLAFSDTIPDLDADQLYAAFCMAEDGNKLLFSDPGAGKTLTAIQAMLLVEEHMDTGRDDERPDVTAVILVPNIAIRTWVRWLTQCYDAVGRDAVVQVIRKGSDKIRLDATHVILTYGLVSQKNLSPVVDAVRRMQYAIFIADESDNLSGTTSNRSVTVFGRDFERRQDALCYNAVWCWLLTGTALPAYNDGLYPALRALFPKSLPPAAMTLRGYVSLFCTTELVKFGRMRQSQEKINGNRNNAMLREILFGGAKPIAIRIKLNLDVDYVEREVTIEPKFSKEFLDLEGQLEIQGWQDGDRVIDPRLATAQRLMGRDCAPEAAAYVLNSFQQDRSNRAVTLGKVVLHMHQEAGQIIANTLIRHGLRVRQINGQTDAAEDAETERRFNAGECDVVVGQITAMGVAINLQEHCDHVIFAEESGSDAKNLQALQRVYRRGQTRTVRVDRLRPMSFLADMKVVSATKKRKGAAEVLDGQTE